MPTKEYHREWRKANQDKAAAAQRRYRAAHPERVKASQKKYYGANREVRVGAAYGWNQTHRERYNALDSARRAADPEKYCQKRWTQHKMPQPTRPRPELCECCGRPPHGKRPVLHLDHCHDINAFRGWLCVSCNLGIGALGDNLAGLHRAVSYLNRDNP